ncbi:hypothetical protein RND71_010089 [Anisodus tanguticus]|uniref:Methyltransferase type 11 domain-containing protein n=1 Tax=Anisodus tanguticus TaxID=243964 RepID=A0AAE1VRV4_9SOLA|nr:hypothetical protein RND71_010089 [Anisodus tanguticus]
MKEVVIDSASSLHTSKSVGETHVLRPVSLRAKCSSKCSTSPRYRKETLDVGKYQGLNPDCFFIGCNISAALINICTDRGHEVLVADDMNLPYRTGYGDAAISITVLHHLSTENRRRKAVEELVSVVKKGGSVLITIWAREQEDMSLIEKWTPLTQRYVEEWIGPRSPRVRNPSSPGILESIPEAEENGVGERLKDRHANSSKISGASAVVLASGLAKRDDKKGSVVYNRYYHVFSEDELERLVSGLHNAILVDRFYDKSNWCIILEKTS